MLAPFLSVSASTIYCRTNESAFWSNRLPSSPIADWVCRIGPGIHIQSACLTHHQHHEKLDQRKIYLLEFYSSTVLLKRSVRPPHPPSSLVPFKLLLSDSQTTGCHAATRLCAVHCGRCVWREQKYFRLYKYWNVSLSVSLSLSLRLSRHDVTHRKLFAESFNCVV